MWLGGLGILPKSERLQVRSPVRALWRQPIDVSLPLSPSLPLSLKIYKMKSLKDSLKALIYTPRPSSGRVWGSSKNTFGASTHGWFLYTLESDTHRLPLNSWVIWDTFQYPSGLSFLGCEMGMIIFTTTDGENYGAGPAGGGYYSGGRHHPHHLLHTPDSGPQKPPKCACSCLIHPHLPPQAPLGPLAYPGGPGDL